MYTKRTTTVLCTPNRQGKAGEGRERQGKAGEGITCDDKIGQSRAKQGKAAKVGKGRERQR